MGAMASPAAMRAAQPASDALGARLVGWLRRLTGAGASAADAPLHAEARLSLGPRKSLVLVNCCGRRVLVGIAGDAMVPLGEWPETAARAKRVSRTRDEAAQ
jgi:flagellar biogenesis protein FliO